LTIYDLEKGLLEGINEEKGSGKFFENYSKISLGGKR
jgi:hypothetical protein